MKRVLSILLAGTLMTTLAACGSTASSESSVTEIPETVASSDSSTNIVEQSAVEELSEKILIVYFSPSNSDTVDAITSATPRVGDTGAVEYLAQMIGNSIGADTAKIVPNTAYPTDYEETADQAKAEQDNDERPTFTLDVNPEDYDVIFVGYPIWWYGLPMIMETFFDTYDFSGKTIVPFNTHAGSGDGGTYSDIADLEPDATVLDGLAVSGNGAADADDEVVKLLTSLGY